MESYIGAKSNDGSSQNKLEKTLEEQLQNLPKMKYPTDEIFRILGGCLGANLTDLINQTSLLHTIRFTTYLEDYEYHPWSLQLKRQRSERGFWNRLARFFGIEQLVLDIGFNGQVWCCKYYEPFYYMISEKVRDFYYAKLYPVVKRGFVIIKS